jgi:hypothetical protein
MQKSLTAHMSLNLCEIFSRAIERAVLCSLRSITIFYVHVHMSEALTTCDIKNCGFSCEWGINFKCFLLNKHLDYDMYVEFIIFKCMYMLQFKMKICKRMCMRMFKIFASIKRGVSEGVIWKWGKV